MRPAELSGDGPTNKRTGAAASLIETLLSAGIDGVGPFESAIEVAEEHRRNAANIDEAIGHLIGTHMRLAAANGFVTGLGGLLTMPFTLPAGILGLAAISTRMSAGIAHLRGYDVNSEHVRSVVVVSLLGSAGADALKNAGVRIGKGALVEATKTLPVAALRMIKLGVGRRLLAKFGQKGLTRAVPVVGGVLGAAIDGVACRSIASYAKKAFPPQPPTDLDDDLVLAGTTTP